MYCMFKCVQTSRARTTHTNSAACTPNSTKLIYTTYQTKRTLHQETQRVKATFIHKEITTQKTRKPF